MKITIEAVNDGVDFGICIARASDPKCPRNPVRSFLIRGFPGVLCTS